MENELKNPSSNVRLEKFLWSEFLADCKMAFVIIEKSKICKK